MWVCVCVCVYDFCVFVCDFERENHKSEICVCDFCVYICVCVYDFGLENHKFEICVFVICVSNFGLGMTGWGWLKTCLLNGLGLGHEDGSTGQVWV